MRPGDHVDSSRVSYTEVDLGNKRKAFKLTGCMKRWYEVFRILAGKGGNCFFFWNCGMVWCLYNFGLEGKYPGE